MTVFCGKELQAANSWIIREEAWGGVNKTWQAETC